MKIYKCGFYRRVSTDEQVKVEEGSLKNQKERLETFLQGKQKTAPKTEKWEFGKDYCDEGKSAKDTNRPQYQQMMRDIEAGEINVILFTEMSRISRSVVDFLELAEFLEEHDADFICTNHPELNTATPHGKILLTILVLMMQFEREINVERSQKAYVNRAERGLWTGGQVLGYDLISDKHGHLNINKEEAKIIQFIFQQYLKVKSVHQIVQLCNQRGYLTKSYVSKKKKLKRGGHKFSYSSVKQILKNPVYIALKIVNNKAEGTTHLVKTDYWEPIIQKPAYNDVKKIIDANSLSKGSPKKTHRYTYLLSDLLWCEHCKSRLTHGGTIKDGKIHPYYIHRKGEAAEGCPLPPNIPADKLDELILGKLVELVRGKMTDQDFMDVFSNSEQQSPNAIAKLQADIQETQRALAERKKEHGNLMISLSKVAQTMDEDTANHLQNLAQSIKSLKTQLEEQKVEMGAWEKKQAAETKIHSILKNTKQNIKERPIQQQIQLVKQLLVGVTLTLQYITLNPRKGNPVIGAVKKNPKFISHPFSYLDVAWD